MSVRDVRWKLHVLPAVDHAVVAPGARWVDSRAPDGVTILAPFDQAHASEYPGVRTGDKTSAMSLFDLENDRGEQHNAAANHPDIVARLKARYDELAGRRKGDKSN